MNIDLESCFVGFLIGVAIYLLLNCVFNIEGIKGKKGQSQSQSLTPAPSLTPGPSLTPDQAKLQDYIDKYMDEDDYDWEDYDPMPRLSTKYTYFEFYHLKDDEFTDFTTLLSNNTGRFLSLKGKSPYLKFGNYHGNVITLSQAVQLVNCFKEDIQGLNIRDMSGDLSAINSLNNKDKFKSLDYVNSLSSGKSGITGTLTDLNEFTNLVYLSLVETNITSNISSLSGLTELQYLGMTGGLSWTGNLTGNIEDSPGIKNLTKLRFLDLGGNLGITGNINALSRLTELRYLDLSDTSVSGDINSLKDLTNLDPTYLNLCPSKISGNIFKTPFATNLYMINTTSEHVLKKYSLDACLNIEHPIKVDCGDRRFNCNNCSSPTQSSTDPPS